jgi:acyl carrier protein
MNRTVVYFELTREVDLMEFTDIRGIVKESTIQIIAEGMELQVGEISICDDDSLIDGGLIDSMSILELIEVCQTEFGISIEPSDLTLENWDSINMISRFVQVKLNGDM